MKPALWSTVLIAGAVVTQLSRPAIAAVAHETASQLIAAADITAQTSPAASTGQIAASLKSPTTAVELLRNLKEALDRGLLLDVAFYDEDNLKTFFNEQRVKWQTTKQPHRLVGDIDGNQRSFQGLQISVDRGSYFEDSARSDGVDPHERVNAHLHIDINTREFPMDADMMRSVFGWDATVSRAPSQYLQGRIGTPVEVTQVQYGAAEPRKPGVGRRFVTFRLIQNETVNDIDIVDERVY